MRSVADLQVARSSMEGNGEHVQQQFGVAGGVHVTEVLVAQQHFKFVSVGQIPVVCKAQAVG